MFREGIMMAATTVRSANVRCCTRKSLYVRAIQTDDSFKNSKTTISNRIQRTTRSRTLRINARQSNKTDKQRKDVKYDKTLMTRAVATERETSSLLCPVSLFEYDNLVLYFLHFTLSIF